MGNYNRIIVPDIYNTYSNGYILLSTTNGVLRVNLSEQEIKKIGWYFEERYLPQINIEELSLEKDDEGNYLFLEIPANKIIGKCFRRRVSLVDGLVNEHWGNTKIYTEE